MFLFAALFQIFIGASLYQIVKAHGEALQNLSNLDEDAELESILAFGQTWQGPLTRIDYGAYHQKNRDVEALCIVARSLLPESSSLNLDCE